MLKNSVIIGFFIFVFHKITEIYNGSLLEKIFAAVCGFFQKKASGSVFLAVFRSNAFDGAKWRESLTFRILTSPIRLVLRIGKRISLRSEKYIAGSAAAEFVRNITAVPLRELGYIASAAVLAFTVMTIILQKMTTASAIAASAMAVICLVLLLTEASLGTIFSDSSFVSFFARYFYHTPGSTEREAYHLRHIWTDIAVGAAVGIAAGLANPLYFVLCLVGVIGVAAVLYKTEIGVFIMIFAAPIAPTMLSAGLIAVTLVSLVLGLMNGKYKGYRITPSSPMLVCFIALSAAGGIISLKPQSSIPVMCIYLLFAMPYVIIVNTIRTREQWYNILVVFAMSALVVSLYGVYQNFAVGSTASSWVDSEMFGEIGTRVYSTLENPNVLGQYFIFTIPVVFAMLCKSKGTQNKLTYFLVLCVMAACLVFTWSRGAWVGVMLALVIFVLLCDRRWTVLCVVGVLLLPLVLPQSILSRITSIGNLKDSSTSYRVSVWIASARMAIDYWLGGIGLGTEIFERVYHQYALNGAGFALHSHNFYLQLIVESGIVGLINFLLIIVCAYKQIFLIKEKNSLLRAVTLAMAGAFAGYLFQGMAENLWYNYRMLLFFWLYLGILQSGANLTKDRLYELKE